MKTDGDLAQRLSDSFVKTILALLALSAVACGVAERIQKLSLFESYWKFLNARATLELLLADLSGDPCWQKFIQSLPDPKQAGATTIADLKRIECTPHHDQMRVNSSRTITPSTLDPSSPEFVTPPKYAHTTDGWYSLGMAEILEHSLVPLWDDLPLTMGELYSSVAGDDIYRWQLQRFQLQQRRGLPLVADRLHRSNAIAESNFLQLQIDDLNAISRVTHSPLSDLDRGLNEFRASIPSTPMDLNLGTAAQAVAFAMVVFTAVLGAYVRVAGSQTLFTHPGTIFHAMLGSRFTELIGYFLLWVPTVSLITLGSAIGWTQGAVIVPAVCAVTVVWSTFSILRRLRPHTKLAGRRRY
jgi:hypothetical protein